MYKITEEEYYAAREVVETYHRQLSETINEIDDMRHVSLKSFMANVDLSERLRNVLTGLLRWRGNIRLTDISAYELSRMYGVGRSSSDEFLVKQEKYLREKRAQERAGLYVVAPATPYPSGQEVRQIHGSQEQET